MKTDTDVLFSRKLMRAVDPTVNISKAVLICNLFHFFFAASKACLLPFLTVFLRMLGMSATETGIIIAFKTITGFVWAPLWARCAISYNKRRFVLMFSLFMFAASYLSLTVLYQHTTHYNICNNTQDANNRLILPSYFKPMFGSSSSTTAIPNIDHSVSYANKSTKHSTTTEQNMTPPSTVPPSKSSETTTSSLVSVLATSPAGTIDMASLKNVSAGIIADLNLTFEDLVKLNTTSAQLYEVLHQAAPNLTVTREDVDILWEMLQEDTKTHARQRRDVIDHQDIYTSVNITWDRVVGKGKYLWNNMQGEKIQLFLIVLLVIIVGEFLSCSIEKVADDSWFDFLDRIDDLEKYGKQRLGGNFAFVVFPLVISLIVEFTECMLPLNVNHFLLHFYAFGSFLAISFVVAYFYPIPPPQKQEFSSKVMTGLKIVCCDCQAFMYILTMLIMGMVYASYHNYLFWVIQDLGGSEMNMGMCVSLGALAEIPMLLISQKMVKKMGNAGVVSLALFFLSMRVLYYSFLPTPWAVMPAELLHAFTHTAMWFAVLSYEDFNVSAMVDRSIRSILSSVYFGVGFTIGCVFFGLAYDVFGYAIMYQGASVIVGAWFIFFSIVSKCIPKKERIRYVKLLHSGDTDDSDSVEDDWLEMALKEH